MHLYASCFFAIMGLTVGNAVPGVPSATVRKNRGRKPI